MGTRLVRPGLLAGAKPAGGGRALDLTSIPVGAVQRSSSGFSTCRSQPYWAWYAGGRRRKHHDVSANDRTRKLQQIATIMANPCFWWSSTLEPVSEVKRPDESRTCSHNCYDICHFALTFVCMNHPPTLFVEAKAFLDRHSPPSPHPSATI